MAKKISTRKNRIALDPMEAVRRLLIMQLLAYGITAETIAEAIECDNTQISKIMSVSAIQKQSKLK